MAVHLERRSDNLFGDVLMQQFHVRLLYAIAFFRVSSVLIRGSTAPRSSLLIQASDTLALCPGVMSGMTAWSRTGMSLCPSVATSTHRPGQGASCPTLSGSFSRIDISSY